MGLSLGASLGFSTLTGTRAPLPSANAAPGSGRARPRVVCQATLGAPTAGAPRVREASPSKVQALAAPAAERDLATPSPPSPPSPRPAAAASNILEVRRADLERLLHRGSPHEEAERQQQGQQQPPEQRQASDTGPQSRPATGAASSSRQQRRSRLVASTRQTRSVAATSAAAALTQQQGGREPAALQAAVARNAAASTAELTSWLLDCRSRRERSAKQPLAARPRRAAAAAALSRTRRGQASEPQAVRLEAAALDGLAEETKQDMLVLIDARSALKCGRRARRGSAVRASGASDTMSSLMRGLGHTAVLSRQQEAALAAILQRGIQLQALAQRLAGELACEAEGVSDEALAAAAGLPGAADVSQRRANQREAKDLLMQYNVRLVINISKRYTGNGIDIVDLIPEGLVGLSKSLDRFEPAKGFKFSTYAHWWIRQSISRAVCDQARVVRLPSHVCESLYRINRAINTLVERSERDELPSYEEIAAEVGLPVRRVVHYLRLSRLPGGSAARSGPTQYTSGASLKDVRCEVMQDCAEDEDPTAEGEEESSQYESMRQMTDLLLSTLEKRERNILRLRYGLLGWNQPAGADPGLDADNGSMSLGEVASAYGLSRERIRQIEDKAMRALRKPWRQQLAQEVKYGQPISPSNLSHLASARQLADHEIAWP